MIDVFMVAEELQQARAVRLAAEEACCDIEKMIEDIARSRLYWQNLVPTILADEQKALPLAA